MSNPEKLYLVLNIGNYEVACCPFTLDLYKRIKGAQSLIEPQKLKSVSFEIEAIEIIWPEAYILDGVHSIKPVSLSESRCLHGAALNIQANEVCLMLNSDHSAPLDMKQIDAHFGSHCEVVTIIESRRLTQASGDEETQYEVPFAVWQNALDYCDGNETDAAEHLISNSDDIKRVSCDFDLGPDFESRDTEYTILPV